MASDGESAVAEEASEGSELPDVTVGQQYFAHLKPTNKKWLIQECYVKEMESGDGKWLQLSSACYGLCNLLCHGRCCARVHGTLAQISQSNLLMSPTRIQQ